VKSVKREMKAERCVITLLTKCDAKTGYEYEANIYPEKGYSCLERTLVRKSGYKASPINSE